MAEVISFDGARKRIAPKQATAQVAQTKANRIGDNQHIRRSLLRMLVYGNSFRTVARKHPGHEEGLTQDIREALLERGAA